MTENREFAAAGDRMDALRREIPFAVAARYEPGLHRVLVLLVNHLEIAINPNHVQALKGKPSSVLETIEISPSGYGLYFPLLDDDIYLPGLFQGIYGTKKWMRENGPQATAVAA